MRRIQGVHRNQRDLGKELSCVARLDLADEEILRGQVGGRKGGRLSNQELSLGIQAARKQAGTRGGQGESAISLEPESGEKCVGRRE